MEILGKIFGSPARVKIMRLFLLNKTTKFKNKEVAKRSRTNADVVKKELKLLASVDFIKKNSRTSLDWVFNPLFKHTEEIENLLVEANNLNKTELLDNFKKVGRVKLIIISGRFIKKGDSRIDLLIVGDKMKRNKIEEGVRKIEAEIGTELIYAIFDTKEFLYRLNMYDKLVRDVLDYPHEVLLQGKDMNLKKTARQS